MKGVVWEYTLTYGLWPTGNGKGEKSSYKKVFLKDSLFGLTDASWTYMRVIGHANLWLLGPGLNETWLKVSKIVVVDM